MTDKEKADKHTIGYWLQFIKENNDDEADFNFGFSKIIEIAKQLEKNNAELKDNVKRLTPLVCEHKADITSCYDDITRLTNENEQQKEQIEKMKCCGNCSETCWDFPIVRKSECINNNYSLWKLAE